jgi:hypothetical protein
MLFFSRLLRLGIFSSMRIVVRFLPSQLFGRRFRRRGCGFHRVVMLVTISFLSRRPVRPEPTPGARPAFDLDRRQ